MLSPGLSPDIFFGLSSRLDGNMRVTDFPLAADIANNRRAFFNKLGLAGLPVVAAGLAHGTKIAVVRQPVEIIDGCDGLITDQRRLILSITVADCLPLYFYDPVKKIVAIVHAGWRGVLANIAAEAVRVFRNNFQSAPADINVFVGPHLRPCHFCVQEDVWKMFTGYRDFIRSSGEQYFIDLAAIVKNQLETVGLKEENINISLDCTYCSADRYFSYRRDKPAEIEAMVAYIGLR